MNKVQRNAIAETLSAVLHKLEKLEDRLAIAQDNGDADDVARLSARIETLSAELKGADAVLAMLGYARQYHDDNERGYYTIEKI